MKKGLSQFVKGFKTPKVDNQFTSQKNPSKVGTEYGFQSKYKKPTAYKTSNDA